MHNPKIISIYGEYAFVHVCARVYVSLYVCNVLCVHGVSACMCPHHLKIVKGIIYAFEFEQCCNKIFAYMQTIHKEV